MFCTRCGAGINEADSFCRNCGAALNLQPGSDKYKSGLGSISPNTHPKTGKSKIIIALIIAIAFLAAGAFIANSCIKSENVKKYINLGNKYLNEGKYEEAILAFNKVIEIKPKNVDARVGLGKTYLAEGKMDEAEKILKEAMSIEPENTEIIAELSKIIVADEELSPEKDDDPKEENEAPEDKTVELYGLTITPNETFAYIYNEDSLVLRNYKDGTEQVIIQGDYINEYNFNLRDGLIAYTANTDPDDGLDADVVLYDLKLKKKTIIETGGPAHSIQWSPDYRYFSVTYGTGAGDTTYIYNVMKKTYTKIPAGTGSPLWSPDGSKAAIDFYWEDYNYGIDVGIYYPEENKIDTIMKGDKKRYCSAVKWQDNNNLIFYVCNESSIGEEKDKYTYYNVNITDSSIKEIGSQMRTWEEEPLYEEDIFNPTSPDGKYKLYADYDYDAYGAGEGRIMLRDMENQSETELCKGDYPLWIKVP